MKEKWLGSKFYKDFKKDSIVKKAEPWDVIFVGGGKNKGICKKMNLDLKLYTLAICYEYSYKK